MNTYIREKRHRWTTAISRQQSAFSYDGKGDRLKATRDGVTTYYIYDMKGNVLAEADGNKNITKYYIHGNGLLSMITNTDQTYAYHFDPIGSTVAMTDMNENIVNSYAYTPFGVLTESETITQPFKYVGQYGVMHEPNGLYYMRARYYDPELGRFTSEDPIGFKGGTVNLYEYVKNNPVRYIDPLGLKWIWPINGNLWPGYTDQDGVCSYPAGSLNNNPCRKKCCVEHDKCYEQYGCNYSSWLGGILIGPCQYCNMKAVACVISSWSKTDCECDK